MNSQIEMVHILKSLVKEVHEMNRRLDRICQASIFSKDTPIVRTELESSNEQDT